MRKILCARNHRMIQILPELFLCECSAYGALADLKGAVPEARDLVDRQGGIELLRDRIEKQEVKARDDRKLEREERPSPRIREGV